MAVGEVQAELGDKLDRWRVMQGDGLEQGEVEKVLGGVWSAEEGERMVLLVNCLQEEDEEELMRKVSATPSGGLSPNIKKRKFSPSKERLELCLTNLERQVDSLTSLVEEEREGLLEKRGRLEEVDRRLQVVLQRL